tara:strand:- start:48 stop:887 length:840 start_codon:yes stop_codon:yes gene_type:complete
LDYINYIDGTWEKTSNSYVPLYDSGFLLGDGLFETIRFDNKTLFKPEKHLIRLYESIDYTDINIQERPKKLLNLLKSIITKNNLTSGLLRLMVTRGNLKGAPWLFNGPAKIYISIRPLTPIEKKPVKVVFFSENKYPIIRFKPAIKSLNYLGNMLAKKDADKLNAYEPVFYNSDGYITECAIRNIFFIKDNELLTPSLNLGVLPGVMRDTIIYISKFIGLKQKEINIPYNSINEMDEAFISSTGIGLLPCFWDKWNSDFKQTIKIKKHLDDLITNVKGE